MPRIEMTCGCGARLDFESRWSFDVQVQANAFLNAHAPCRTRQEAPDQPVEEARDG